MTDRDLITIQRAALQAFKRMRNTSIISDDFPDLRECAELALDRAEHAYAEWAAQAAPGGSQVCPICGLSVPHYHSPEIVDIYRDPCTCVNALYEGNCAVHGLKEKL